MKTKFRIFCGAAVLVLLLAACPVWAQEGPGGPPPPPPGGGGQGMMPPPPPFGGPGGGPGGPGGGPGMMAPPPSLEEADTNQDGNVTVEEFTAAWNKTIKTMFTHLDANADGVISKEERPARPDMGRGQRGPGEGRRGGPGEGPGRGPKPPLPSKEELDTNKDGQVSQEEFVAGMTQANLKLFKRFDTDANGTLSAEELQKALEPGPGGPGGPHGPGGPGEHGGPGGPGGPERHGPPQE